jgi:carboxypeptidase Q
MLTLRRRALQLFALAALFGALTTSAAAQSARGPSTPDERARVSQLADAARKDPLGVQAANAAWFEQWISDVPDYTFKPEAVAKWCMRAAKGDMKKILQFQFGVSALSYQVKHNLPDPAKPADVAAVNLAGLDGVLAAYETLLAKDDANRSPKMDEALARRNKGELAAFASEIAQ